MSELITAVNPLEHLGAVRTLDQQVSDLLPFLTEAELLEMDDLLQHVSAASWQPLPGPQQQALECEADILFYGGAAGGGKTDLLLGATLQHIRSIIFRREYPQLKAIKERAEEIYGKVARYNGQQELWRWFKGPRRVEFGACQYEGDENKYQGRPHDLKCFDEITHFTEQQFRFLITWNRTPNHKQRTRIICAGNPPTTAEGMWVINYWKPWLDITYPKPAVSGEIRWFVTNTEGDDIEVDGPDPVWVGSGGDREQVKPKSRSFIRAKIEDNPYLMSSGYKATLQALPEPLRSRMLRGDFGVGDNDHEWQVIPAEWILKAQARWAPTYDEFLQKRAASNAAADGDDAATAAGAKDQRQNENIPNSALEHGAGQNLDLYEFIGKIRGGETETTDFAPADYYAQTIVGVDISRGGRDRTTFAKRVGFWFDTLMCLPGAQTKTGNEVVQKLIETGLAAHRIQMDVSGVGTSPVDIGTMLQLDIVPMVYSEKSRAHDRSGKLGFCNTRAEWWWRFREMLDPLLGYNIALPPDAELLADLTAPRWLLTPRGILVEEKRIVKERIGRSPDKGDAVVLAAAIPYKSGIGYLEMYREEMNSAEIDTGNAAQARNGTPKAGEHGGNP